MARGKSIKSIFPVFLLPSRKVPLPASRPIDASLSQTAPATTPVHLARSQSDTLRCSTCSADLALATQIISKGFTGRHGRAFLVAPPATSPGSAAMSSYSTPDLINVRVGRCESRQLVTGWHTVADITCAVCQAKLGWKYVDAKEGSQRYKVGKFILEMERVITYRSWEDVPASPVPTRPEDDNRGSPGNADKDEEGVVEFDSDDEDECDDIFAGTWDREAVAKKRMSQRMSSGS